jgi:hypothetical protein
VRQVSGKFYGDVLKERVFGPPGMPARIIRRPTSYRIAQPVTVSSTVAQGPGVVAQYEHDG